RRLGGPLADGRARLGPVAHPQLPPLPGDRRGGAGLGAHPRARRVVRGGPVRLMGFKNPAMRWADLVDALEGRPPRGTPRDAPQGAPGDAPQDTPLDVPHSTRRTLAQPRSKVVRPTDATPF